MSKVSVEARHSSSHDVGWQHVRRELKPNEGAANDLGKGLDTQRLGDARHAFEQAMTLGDQTHQDAFEHASLAHHHSFDLKQGGLKRRRRR